MLRCAGVLLGTVPTGSGDGDRLLNPPREFLRPRSGIELARRVKGFHRFRCVLTSTLIGAQQVHNHEDTQ